MPDATDSYLVAARAAECEIKEKGSRFIARVFPLSSQERIEETLQGLRKREHDATHHCFAWRLWRGPAASADADVFRYSDDGEPSGSAGKPIYDQLCGAGLHNTLVVVTRYFGGTKLGVGGLVRAYGAAAKSALEAAGATERYERERFELIVEFTTYTPLTRLLNELNAETVTETFSDQVSLTVAVRRTLAERFYERFVELTHGKGEIRRQPAQAGESDG
ncbi:MAG TPA: YigZ family protein [candidate division Zixibacteria bacterium]|nr:YigZ family protein [candidate division Zixibacteria bacterium]